MIRQEYARQGYRYGSGAVYGSSAYDFNNPALYPDVEYGKPLERPAPKYKEREQTKTRTKVRRAPRAKQAIAPSAMIGILIVATLFVSFLMSNATLMQISAETVDLQSQLDVHLAEQAKLKISYESAFNLSEIEEYATTQLGMQKANADQIVYIDTSSPDRAVVITERGGEGLVDRVADFISGIGGILG